MSKKTLWSLAVLAAASLALPSAASAEDIYRERSDFGKMLHKLGRGVVNVVTCWVEIPRHIASEWERTDPATGLFVGTIKGVGWTFARGITGVYEAVTFPIPVPADYEAMIQPEFVVTDTWGDPIPDLTELDANDPLGPSDSNPQQYRF